MGFFQKINDSYEKNIYFFVFSENRRTFAPQNFRLAGWRGSSVG